MTRRRLHIAAVVLTALVSFTSPGAAQTTAPATLIADNIRFNGSSTVTAEGAVEVFFGGARLRAESITYDGTADNLRVQGPLTLVDETGSTVFIAEFAELSADLQEGVLQSARLVLDRQLQIAATEITRTEGRYTQIYQAVASSCEVCFDHPTPLWEIRARRVIHDAEEQQLYFDNAQFRVLGIPVFFLPRMRLPDPTLERATGFLAPTIGGNSTTGRHLQVPYFIELGDHADITVTPWIGVGTQTVDLRYRQAFRNGDLTAVGAASWDDLTTSATRAYMFANASFSLPREFRLDLQVQAVSDRGYLATYGFSDTNLLESYARISRVRRDEYIEASATVYQSLRDGVDNDVLPTRVAHAEITRRITPAMIGGTLTASLEGTGFYRYSTVDATATEANGRDVFRITGELDWRRSQTFGGLLATFEGALHGGVYNTQQDPAFGTTVYRLTPYGAVELRYPVQAMSPSGVSHVIEPVAQVVWSDTYGDAAPNEDSFIVEFDEANLFSLDRLPGSDRRETGARANIGLSYSRIAPDGWTVGVGGGVVLRDEDEGQFTDGSGLNGLQSDFILAAHVTYPGRLTLMQRSLFDRDLSFTSSEVSLSWYGERHSLASVYTFLAADEGEQRSDPLSELLLVGNYSLASGWDAGAVFRYDFAEDFTTNTAFTLGYANECVDMEFSVSRRYTNSTSVAPATTFGLTVSLAGFGAGREGRSVSRSCRG
ncbi:LPS-assembly protein LptD [Jannaschia sp. CCS1]|uniref:LPS-assembly protein LptD n=1 Tax=Jannaschia sp. (strain CCS1) TaxID=290400 RepID=UPI000053A8FF|nr:LPS assembly protein LptD [Jannaschia sp. CCS1]ABD54729.1 organic solvent tolerance protein putative [Jannaschia sp. CCS1]